MYQAEGGECTKQKEERMQRPRGEKELKVVKSD